MLARLHRQNRAAGQVEGRSLAMRLPGAAVLRPRWQDFRSVQRRFHESGSVAVPWPCDGWLWCFLRQRQSCRRGALERRNVKADGRFCPGLRRTWLSLSGAIGPREGNSHGSADADVRQTRTWHDDGRKRSSSQTRCHAPISAGAPVAGHLPRNTRCSEQGRHAARWPGPMPAGQD